MIRPSLAHDEVEWNHRKLFPCYTSPKIDGIRGRVIGGTLVSRAGKPFKNRFTSDDFSHSVLEGFDGELVMGNPWDRDCIEKSKSAVSTITGEPCVTFYVFDDFSEPALMFSERYIRLQDRVAALGHPRIQVVPQWMVNNKEQVLKIEEFCLSVGYEGLILKLPEEPYHTKRATKNNPFMMKLKRFKDSEARVVGYFEEMENTNAQTTDAHGYATRSSHQDGMVGKNRLGGFILRYDGSDGSEDFRVGSGFTAEQREQYWLFRDNCIGHIVKFKHFEHGAKDKPRHAVFLGFRNPEVEG